MFLRFRRKYRGSKRANRHGSQRSRHGIGDAEHGTSIANLASRQNRLWCQIPAPAATISGREGRNLRLRFRYCFGRGDRGYTAVEDDASGTACARYTIKQHQRKRSLLLGAALSTMPQRAGTLVPFVTTFTRKVTLGRLVSRRNETGRRMRRPFPDTLSRDEW